VNNLNDRGISFHSLQENITVDKASATGHLCFIFLQPLPNLSVILFRNGSAAGRAAARARGRLGGRPEKLDKKELEMLKTLVANGAPITDIAQRWVFPEQLIIGILKRNKSMLTKGREGNGVKRERITYSRSKSRFCTNTS
jgi:DNA invertase Pin-like site-specific DNA recombinase